MKLPRRQFPHLATGAAALPAVLAVLCLMACASQSRAQGFPTKPVRIIVPLPPGATADTLPRLIGEKLTAKWGQPVIIVNRPGAAQNLGAEIVARAEPDGYTLLATPQGPLVISQSLFAKLNFDPAAFVPITIMASLPYVLVARPGSQITNLQEFIARAKAEPGELTYATPGVGSPNHLAMEWFSSLAGVKLTHVPYQGAAPALVDVLAGRVDAMFDNAGNVMQLIHAGKLRALAVTSQKRMDELASTPAIAETFPAFVVTSWFAVVAPPKTPPTIVNALSVAMIEALRAPDIAKKAHDLSSTVVASTPSETEVFLKQESETWRKVIQGAGIKLE